MIGVGWAIARTEENELRSSSIGVKQSMSNSSTSATASILSRSRTPPTTWYWPVRSSARAVIFPSPDDVPVITTSFFAPNLEFACIVLPMFTIDGIWNCNIHPGGRNIREAAMGHRGGRASTRVSTDGKRNINGQWWWAGLGSNGGRGAFGSFAQFAQWVA